MDSSVDEASSDSVHSHAHLRLAGANTEPRTKWQLLAYGGLALPLSVAEIPILLYLPAFYTSELGLNASSVGIVFLLARMWDGLSDLLIGWLSDRTTSRFGRRKPWVVVGAPLLMVSTWYLCNPPKSAGLVYLCVYAVLFYASFTAVKIPHLSWGTELAADYVERNRVSMYRETFTNLGNLLFVLVPLVLLGENPRLHEVLLLQSGVVLVLVPPLLFPLARWILDPLPAEKVNTPFFGELAELAKDRVLLRFLVGRFLFATEEGITNSLLVFSFCVGLDLSTRQFFWAILILYVASLAVTPLTLRLARHVEKHKLLAGAVLLQAVSYFAVYWVPDHRFEFVAPLWILIGIANAAMTSMPPSIVADIIDHGDVMSGERRSGTYVAIDNLLFKLGMALGVGISFGLLTWIRFNPAITQHSAADIRNIRLLGFALPGVLSMTAAVIYLTHPITRKVQQDLRGLIRARQLDVTGCLILSAKDSGASQMR